MTSFHEQRIQQALEDLRIKKFASVRAAAKAHGVDHVIFVARSKQVYIEWMEATVLLSIYLRSELILIDTKVLSARCPLADVPGSACEAPPPLHLADVYQQS